MMVTGLTCFPFEKLKHGIDSNRETMAMEISRNLKGDADPERRAAYLVKEKEYWLAKEKAGKIKSVNTLSPWEQCPRRRHWRSDKRISRL